MVEKTNGVLQHVLWGVVKRERGSQKNITKNTLYIYLRLLSNRQNTVNF